MKIFELGRSARQLRHRFGEHRNDLYRVALSWCGDRMLADDLAQEALTRALDKQHQLRDAKKLEHWLFRILNNCWREHLRRLHPTVEIEGLVLGSDHTPERGLRKQQVIDRVRSAIDRLPLGQRQVVTLVDLQGFSYAEVAEVLEIPIGTVMSRVCRARLALKAELISLHGELSPERCHLRSVK
ncbi:MAG: RNA polymerase sigma factor [Candidatus Thiodiazotropha sp.]|jgi:RNA polymerase sigma-70 factor, ECF subfamily